MSNISSPFGQNEWLVEEMYRKFRDDPSSVDPSWHEFLVDYNPDAAMPADPSWDSFLNAVFGVSLADTTFVSYEFDYYDSCHDHWRDANYSGTSQQSGTIGDC